MPFPTHLRPAAKPEDVAMPAMPTPLRPPRRTRSKLLILLGLVLSAMCAVGAVSVFQSASATTAVVAVDEPVRYGETITESALREVDLRAQPGLEPVPWDERGDLIGRTATSDLAVGTLVTATEVTGQLPPGPGQQLIGVPVKTAQAPTTPLLPRWPILLVATDTPDWDPVHAVVLRTSSPDATGLRVVDVVVPAADGPRLAAKAASGDVVLIVLPQGAG